MKAYKVNCSRCEGTGVVKEFAHIDGGKCFQCEGVGKIEVSKEEYESHVDSKSDFIFYNILKNKAVKVPFENVNVSKGVRLGKGKEVCGVMVSMANIIDVTENFIAFQISNNTEEVMTEILRGLYTKELKATIEDVEGIFNNLPKGLKETTIKSIEKKINEVDAIAKELLKGVKL